MNNQENKVLVVNPNTKEIYNIYDFLNFNNFPIFSEISLAEIAPEIDEFIEFFNTECIFENEHLSASKVRDFNQLLYNLKKMFSSVKIESNGTI